MQGLSNFKKGGYMLKNDEIGGAGGMHDRGDKGCRSNIGGVIVGDPDNEILHPANEIPNMKTWELRGREEE